MSRGAWGRIFLFSWEKLRGAFQETIISSKTVPEVLNMKYRSESKNGFINRDCLHCAALRTTVLRKKIGRAHKASDMQFFLQNVQD